MSDQGPNERQIITETHKDPSIYDLRQKIEHIELELKLQELERKRELLIRPITPIKDKSGKELLYNSIGTRINRDQIQDLTPAEQHQMMLDFRSIKDNQFTDGNIMMEGPLDHMSNQGPSERFMPLFIDPFKFAVLARFTAIGHRITFEVYQDAWAGGLSLILKGKDMQEKQEEINKKLHDHFIQINLQDSWELAGGFKRENGDSILLLHFEGEFGAIMGNVEGSKVMQNFSYMEKKAPLKPVARIEAFSKLDYRVLQDDGRGNPFMFQIQLFLGQMTGSQIVNVHHTRIIHLKRVNVERGHEGMSVQQPCYNEEVMATGILKAMGEIAFRWAYGKPLILTKGLNDATLAQFKANLGNPTREAWHVLPAEWIESFELLSNNTSVTDLPAMLEKMIEQCVMATSIPKPVMMGDVAGVNTDNTVNNQNYFALLGKIQNNDSPKLIEFFNKDIFIRELLQGLSFEFDWGIRFSMSAEDKVNLDTKEIANDVTRLNYMTHNEIREQNDLPPLEDVIENDKEYAIMLGNSISSYTQFEKAQAKAQIESQKEIAKIKASAKTMGRTVLGNDGKGKGQGVGHGQGTERRKIKQPENKQTAKATAISRVRNTISKVVSELRDQMSVNDTAKALETNKASIYKWIGWKEDLEDE